MPKPSMKVGDKFPTTKWGNLTIIDYQGYTKVRVMFDKTGYTTTAQATQIRNGNVKDWRLPSLYGIGIVGAPPKGTRKNPVKSYMVWADMLRRCYSPEQTARFPTYVGCTVCEEWKYYPVFKQWFDYHYKEGKQLDKDSLVKGNTLYSPHLCSFVTSKVNNHPNNKKLSINNSSGVKGVSWCNKRKKWRASCSINTHVDIGFFDSKEDATNARENFISANHK